MAALAAGREDRCVEEDLAAEQMRYYRARASEYDQDTYASPAAQQLIAQVVDRVPAGGEVLELACGAGVWTQRLVDRADSVTAVDAAPEMIAIARIRAPGPRSCRPTCCSGVPTAGLTPCSSGSGSPTYLSDPRLARRHPTPPQRLGPRSGHTSRLVIRHALVVAMRPSRRSVRRRRTLRGMDRPVDRGTQERGRDLGPYRIVFRERALI